MADREKVIQRIEYILSDNRSEDGFFLPVLETVETLEDALSLLKAQEPMTDKERHDLEKIAKVRGGGTLKVVCADYVLWNHGYYCREMGKRVAVVRCADCTGWEPEVDPDGNCGRCRMQYAICNGMQTGSEFFCADGERKEET